MPIAFVNVAHQFYYEKIKGLLDKIDGSYGFSTDTPTFFYTKGSAQVHVQVLCAGDDEGWVKVGAWVVMGANVADPALLQFLLRENGKMATGALGIDPDGDICLSHAVLASGCDEKQLRVSIDDVLIAADALDDEICRRWGGRLLGAPEASAAAAPAAVEPPRPSTIEPEASAAAAPAPARTDPPRQSGARSRSRARKKGR